MIEIRRKPLRRRRFEIVDSDDFVTDLRLSLLHERGTIDDDEIRYEISRGDSEKEPPLELKHGAVVLADATGDLMQWRVGSTERVYALRQHSPVEPLTTILIGDDDVGAVAKTGRFPEVVTVSIRPAEHPAIEAFIGVVAMIGWRRTLSRVTGKEIGLDVFLRD